METLGEAWRAGFQAHARCVDPQRPSKFTARCTWARDLDMTTLVATRGRDMPLALLNDRLRCPACGSRRVVVILMSPPASGAMRSGGRP